MIRHVCFVRLCTIIEIILISKQNIPKRFQSVVLSEIVQKIYLIKWSFVISIASSVVLSCIMRNLWITLIILSNLFAKPDTLMGFIPISNESSILLN